MVGENTKFNALWNKIEDMTKIQEISVSVPTLLPNNQ
jgi:hypothetical protein